VTPTAARRGRTEVPATPSLRCVLPVSSFASACSPPDSDVWDGKNATSWAFRPAKEFGDPGVFLPGSAAAIRCAIVGLEPPTERISMQHHKFEECLVCVGLGQVLETRPDGCWTIPDPYASARHCREVRPTNACASRRPRPLGLESVSPQRPPQEWRSVVHPLPRRRRPLSRIQDRR
jgi:hypothetical protein